MSHIVCRQTTSFSIGGRKKITGKEDFGVKKISGMSKISGLEGVAAPGTATNGSLGHKNAWCRNRLHAPRLERGAPRAGWDGSLTAAPSGHSPADGPPVGDIAVTRCHYEWLKKMPKSDAARSRSLARRGTYSYL